MFENDSRVTAKIRASCVGGLRTPSRGTFPHMEDYQPSEAAQLIESRRSAKHVSVRKAAAAAELSEGRWRQIALGYQAAARGTRVPVNAPADTLARMAAAVGVTPAEMDEIDRSDVAALLRDMGEVDAPAPASLTAVPDDVLLEEIARRFARGKTVKAGGEHVQRSAPNTQAPDGGAPDGATRGDTRSFDEQPQPEATTRSPRAPRRSDPA